MLWPTTEIVPDEFRLLLRVSAMVWLLKEMTLTAAPTPMPLPLAPTASAPAISLMLTTSVALTLMAPTAPPVADCTLVS